MSEPTKRTHRCSGCGKTGPWGPSWEWYGALSFGGREPHVEAKTCSPECKAAVGLRWPGTTVHGPAVKV